MSIVMRKYERVNKDLVSLKNRQKAMLREYGDIPVYEKTISLFEEEKKSLLRQVLPFIQEEYSLVKYIKGVGPTLIARLLAVAHPNRFSTKTKYLLYCGYKDTCRKTHKYNRTAKSILYLMAEATMMHRDPVFRDIYDAARAWAMKKTCASCWVPKRGLVCYRSENMEQKVCKSRSYGVALNRTATQIAKTIWERLHNISSISQNTQERTQGARSLLKTGLSMSTVFPER